ncbi:hypothetical protein [Allomuricauda sp. d1]|uniref:hypothetical protein n=1 Tax=Allomuricauda sp. d1 TaxID=3136725 RepID=UPI0031D1A776
MSNRNPILQRQFSGDEKKTPKAVVDFRKDLDRFFFGDSTIACIRNEFGQVTELVVSISCNFGITESLHHLNRGDWGGFVRDRQYRSQFDRSLLALRKKCSLEIDISEFTINFLDTSIIISKIYPNSIPDYLDAILNAVSLNFVHFTKAMTEMPYEIFVPVFIEEMNVPKLEKLRNQNLDMPRSYFDFWGLYFSSNQNNEATVYDVNEKKIIEGDFLLLDF